MSQNKTNLGNHAEEVAIGENVRHRLKNIRNKFLSRFEKAVLDGNHQDVAYWRAKAQTINEVLHFLDGDEDFLDPDKSNPSQNTEMHHDKF